jgi:hypothetical protein
MSGIGSPASPASRRAERSPPSTPGFSTGTSSCRNSVVFGSVNADRQHYELAAEALAKADPNWLAGLVTRQVPIGNWADAYTRQPDDIKTVLTFPGASS